MLFAFAVVPKVQSRARARHTTSADDHTEEVAKNLLSGVHSQFPAGREDGFPQHFEASKLPQCQAKINFLANKVLLIEAANRLKVASRGKKKRAGAKIEPKVKAAKQAHKNAAPERNEAIYSHHCPAPGIPGFEAG